MYIFILNTKYVGVQLIVSHFRFYIGGNSADISAIVVSGVVDTPTFKYAHLIFNLRNDRVKKMICGLDKYRSYKQLVCAFIPEVPLLNTYKFMRAESV